MHSRRKIDGLSGRDCKHLRQAITQCRGINERQRQDAEKDFLLIEAALNGDKIVLSVDNRSRRAYCEMSKTIREFGEIYWINPVEQMGDMTALLKGEMQFRAVWRLDPARGA